MTKTATPKHGLNKASQYHSVVTILSNLLAGLPGEELDIRKFMTLFRSFVKRWHGYEVDYSYQWIRHSSGTIFLALTGSRSVLAAFQTHAENTGISDRVHMQDYGHRNFDFEEAVTLLFSPIHGRFGRAKGSSQ